MTWLALLVYVKCIGGAHKGLGAVMYAANVLGSRGSRKIQVAIPAEPEDGSAFLDKETISWHGWRIAIFAISSASSANRPDGMRPCNGCLGSKFYLSFYLSVCISDYWSVFLLACLHICISDYLSACLLVCLFISLSVYLSLYLSVCRCLPVCLSLSIYLYLSCLYVYLSVCISDYFNINNM